MRRYNAPAQIIPCDDCRAILTIRQAGTIGGQIDRDWFMVKERVWRAGQREGACRFLCIKCLETRIRRKLSPADFLRSAKVNFVGDKSPVLRRRMLGLKPAKRLIETRWTP